MYVLLYIWLKILMGGKGCGNVLPSCYLICWTKMGRSLLRYTHIVLFAWFRLRAELFRYYTHHLHRLPSEDSGLFSISSLIQVSKYLDAPSSVTAVYDDRRAVAYEFSCSFLPTRLSWGLISVNSSSLHHVREFFAGIAASTKPSCDSKN